MCIDVDELPTDDFQAAEPGYDDANAVEASSLAIPTISTPLCRQLLEKLANTNDEDIMDSLANLCLFGELMYKPPTGSAAQPADDLTRPYSLSMRIENLLTKTNQQRQLHINTLAARHDPRAQRGDSLIFNDDDMREVLNEWRKQPQTWMRSDTLQNLSNLTPQAVHQKTKSAFSTMLFKLVGDKSLTATFPHMQCCTACLYPQRLCQSLEGRQRNHGVQKST